MLQSLFCLVIEESRINHDGVAYLDIVGISRFFAEMEIHHFGWTTFLAKLYKLSVIVILAWTNHCLLRFLCILRQTFLSRVKALRIRIAFGLWHRKVQYLRLILSGFTLPECIIVLKRIVIENLSIVGDLWGEKREYHWLVEVRSVLFRGAKH